MARDLNEIRASITGLEEAVAQIPSSFEGFSLTQRTFYVRKFVALAEDLMANQMTQESGDLLARLRKVQTQFQDLDTASGERWKNELKIATERREAEQGYTAVHSLPGRV